MRIVFEESARALLIVHGVLGFAAVFTATHHAASSVLAARGKRVHRQLQRFGWLAPATLVGQALFGLALYPTYRVRVRLAHLDESAPRVAQLFELKEHFAGLALAVVLAASLAGRALPSQAPVAESRSVALLSTSGAVLLWVAAILGLYVTARHPVGLP